MLEGILGKEEMVAWAKGSKILRSSESFLICTQGSVLLRWLVTESTQGVHTKVILL